MQFASVISETHVHEVVKSIFAVTSVAYEAYSQFETPTDKFHNGDALLAHVGGERAVGRKDFDFAIHYPEVGGNIKTTKIALRPDKCDGATWREKTEGWGLIGLQFGYMNNGLVKCSVAVNSEKRAQAWFQAMPDLGDPDLWAWPLVQKHCRRLIRKLKSVA